MSLYAVTLSKFDLQLFKGNLSAFHSPGITVK
jgi:hypothetical protein